MDGKNSLIRDAGCQMKTGLQGILTGNPRPMSRIQGSRRFGITGGTAMSRGGRVKNESKK